MEEAIMMQTIDRETLKQWMDEKRDITLVDVLPADKFEDFHLPGAINVPLDADFEMRIQEHFPDRFQAIVVYCYDHECSASPRAAETMQRLGYQKVYDYEAGKMDWRHAGLPVEEGD
jgi:rhodanese-related sulfurtransferase